MNEAFTVNRVFFEIQLRKIQRAIEFLAKGDRLDRGHILALRYLTEVCLDLENPKWAYAVSLNQPSQDELLYSDKK